MKIRQFSGPLVRQDAPVTLHIQADRPGGFNTNRHIQQGLNLVHSALGTLEGCRGIEFLDPDVEIEKRHPLALMTGLPLAVAYRRLKLHEPTPKQLAHYGFAVEEPHTPRGKAELLALTNGWRVAICKQQAALPPLAIQRTPRQFARN